MIGPWDTVTIYQSYLSEQLHEEGGTLNLSVDFDVGEAELVVTT